MYANAATLFVLLAATADPDPDVAAAVAKVEKLGGRITRQDDKPDGPVVEVFFVGPAGTDDRLRAELPGILLWAIESWQRLRERGRFVQPASEADLVEDMEALSSPVGAFVRERCRVGPGFRVEVGDLYAAWRSWCELHGRKEPGTEETFGRDLRAAVPSLGKARLRTREGRLFFYTGIRLRVDSDPDDQPDCHPGHSGHSDRSLHAWGYGTE